MNDSGKKILFIIPYIPYPLDTGGNQAFFNIVDYLRNFMDVSVLLDTSSHGSSQKVEALQKEWQNVTFYLSIKRKTIRTVSCTASVRNGSTTSLMLYKGHSPER